MRAGLLRARVVPAAGRGEGALRGAWSCRARLERPPLAVGLRRRHPSRYAPMTHIVPLDPHAVRGDGSIGLYTLPAANSVCFTHGSTCYCALMIWQLINVSASLYHTLLHSTCSRRRALTRACWPTTGRRQSSSPSSKSTTVRGDPGKQNGEGYWARATHAHLCVTTASRCTEMGGR